jgi:hypothetical protein
MRLAIRPVCAVVFALAAAAARADAPCPTVEAPPSAHVQQVASDTVLNGQHSRLARFDMTGTEDDVLAFYRTHFGARHVENTVAGARVIAAREGECFVTVRAQSRLAGLVEATVIATRIGGDLAQSRVAHDTRSLLPADTAIFQTQESNDNGTPALLLVAGNQLGIQADRDALVEQLRARGFRIQHENATQVDGRPSLSLSLASPTEEALVTISDTGAWRSLVILRSRKSP